MPEMYPGYDPKKEYDDEQFLRLFFTVDELHERNFKRLPPLDYDGKEMGGTGQRFKDLINGQIRAGLRPRARFDGQNLPIGQVVEQPRVFITDGKEIIPTPGLPTSGAPQTALPSGPRPTPGRPGPVNSDSPGTRGPSNGGPVPGQEPTPEFYLLGPANGIVTGVIGAGRISSDGTPLGQPKQPVPVKNSDGQVIPPGPFPDELFRANPADP